jgi:hypothetical protein
MLCCTVQKVSNLWRNCCLHLSSGQKSNCSGRNGIDAGEKGQESGLEWTTGDRDQAYE